jgi:ribosomal protein S18 acetylase RimI-like enzyme
MVRLVPMNEDELELLLEKSIPEYAAENVAAGYWSEDEALERSQKVFHGLLPQGVKTENNDLFRIRVEESGEKIGTLWMKHETPRPQGFIYDFVIDETQRGKGYGCQSMLALEDVAKELGIESLALHVFTKNKVAKGLYESLGYKVTSQNMAKRLKR